MNDINKLFEEMSKAEEEGLIEDLGLTEKDLEGQQNNQHLRKMMYLLMEGVSLAARKSNDRVLEELCAQRIQPFWLLMSDKVRDELQSKNQTNERFEMSVYEQWMNDFEDSELGKLIWNMLVGVEDGELMEIQSDHREHMKHLENRIETLETAVFKIAQQITSPPAPLEETK